MSVQKNDHPSVKVCIPGVSGTGKSTLFEKLIRREKARWIFLYDHKHGDLSRRFGTRPCYSAEDLEDAIGRGGYVIFDPGQLFPGKVEAGFEFFSAFVFAVCCQLKGRKIFGADELDALVDARNEPDNLLVLLDQGRTFQIDCFFICQAMNSLHNQVRKQMTEIFAFRQGDKNGIQWLADKGFNADELANMKNGLWLYKNMVTGETKAGGSAFEPKNSARRLEGL